MQLNQELLNFIETSPSPFHAVSSMTQRLEESGYVQIHEDSSWDLKPGKYYVTRNGSLIVAFVLGTDDLLDTGIRMVGAHTDSPCLRVKPNPEQRRDQYLNLGVEVYGGVLLNPWFDRDLSLAGRVTFENDQQQIISRLINFKRPIGTVPSLAIHLDREANKDRTINPQKDIPPLLLIDQESSQSFEGMLKDQLKLEHGKVSVKQILGHELSFYDTQPPALIGLNQDFIASARLDNLLSCFIGLSALLSAGTSLSTLLVCNDHEEVGSTSAEGAQGPLLKSILERIIPDNEIRYRTLSKSMLISADNAHGIHPNFPDKHDSNHGPLLNQGPVIKINANQRYATNSETAAYFRSICEKQNVPCQAFVVRTDMACGNTIGPLTAKEIGVRTLDIGVPTFGMHSIRELAGSKDSIHLMKALSAFYNDAGDLGANSC
ncbi:MAG: M18 family aminopeptidase [Pseudomonadales bacterium]|nr:M18 family aminopeptidase [Pseudomonadales bacterium]